MDKKASGKALLPFGIFVGIYLATGMILNFQGVEMAFYQLPGAGCSNLGYPGCLCHVFRQDG